MDRNGLFDNCTKDVNRKVILTWMKRDHELKQYNKDDIELYSLGIL